jgi:ribose 5-phosphate isomerase A
MTKDEIKQAVAKRAAEFVTDGMILGIGTGTTAKHLLYALAARMKDGLRFTGVPTSAQTEQFALGLNIPMMSLDETDEIQLAIDGADEVSEHLDLIKGGGGAFLQEKMVAFAAAKFIVIGDESKLVTSLGKFPLPVEIVPYGIERIKNHIANLGCKQVSLRHRNDKVYITDHGHYVLDCHFGMINDPVQLNISLKEIPGVVETGLFLQMADVALIGYANGMIRELHGKR